MLGRLVSSANNGPQQQMPHVTNVRSALIVFIKEPLVVGCRGRLNTTSRIVAIEPAVNTACESPKSFPAVMMGRWKLSARTITSSVSDFIKFAFVSAKHIRCRHNGRLRCRECCSQQLQKPGRSLTRSSRSTEIPDEFGALFWDLFIADSRFVRHPNQARLSKKGPNLSRGPGLSRYSSKDAAWGPSRAWPIYFFDDHVPFQLAKQVSERQT